MDEPLEIIRGPRRFEIQRELLVEVIRERFGDLDRPVRILEAGCGRKWILDLGDLEYELTGLDISREALDLRQNVQGDLDKGVVGDLRTAELESDHYDVIFCSNVLEHIDGAERVWDNFFRWLRPGGIACVIHPDRDSVFGLATRLSPHRIHVAYYKWIKRYAHAGEPGYAPFPTFYDRIVSRRGVRAYSARRGHQVVLERGLHVPTPKFEWFTRGVGRLTRERLKSKYNAMLFVVAKG